MMAPPAAAAPTEASACPTLSRLFLARCADPRQPAFTFVRGALDQTESLDRGQLQQRVTALASRLLACSTAGDRVLIALPPGLDFVCAFWACLLTGRVAVPVPAPDAARLKNSAPHLQAVARDAQAAVLLCTEGIRDILASSPESFALDTAHCVLVDAEPDGAAPDTAAVLAAADAVKPQSLAYLQYTSGSTSAPRGVMLTHQQVLAQCRHATAAHGIGADSRILCWLPHYHDYGLVLGLLWPFHAGAPAWLMSPLAFLRRPLRWLEAVERWRITHSGAPNFAYVACLKALDDAPGWQAALDSLLNCSCGAEPIHADTLRRFSERLAVHGLRADAVKPAYGMAEAVLCVSTTPAGRGLEADRLDPDALAAHAVRAAAPGADRVAPIVACGEPIGGLELAIVEPANGVRLGESQIGEIWVRGDCVGAGYWQQPERTRETFEATLPDGSGPWLRTGDLGYLRAGSVFVTGRLKDLIIVRGRNVYPQDIEWTAQAVDPSLRAGHGAAFALAGPEGEAVVLVQELDKRERDADLPALMAAMRRAVAHEHELPLHTLVLVRSGSLPRTSSGKIRRHRCAELFQAGELQVVLQQRFGADGATPGESDLGDLVARLRSATGETEQQAAMAALLLAACADALGRETQALSLAHSAVENGLDSLSAVRVLARLDEALDLAIAPGALLAQPDLESGAHALWRAWRSRAPAAASPHRDAPLTPDRVPLAELDATHLERLAARVPGGPANVQDVYRLAPLQEGLLVLAQLQPRGDAYVARQIGAFADRAALDAALQGLQRLVQRHGAWRTLFAWDGLPHPVQVVLREASLPVHEHAAAPGDDALARLEALSDPLTHTLDLAQAPLVRCDVLHDAAHGRWLLALRMHHLVFDQVSFDLVREELDAIVAGREAELPPAPDYRDFVQATRAGLAADHDAFFRQQFAGLDAGTRAFGLDRAEPGEVRSHRLRLPHAQAARLRRAARQHGCTSATLTHTAWALLLARAAQRSDPVFGTVLSGRLTPAARLGRTVGLFVNTLPLRLPLAGLSAARALRQTQSALRELVRHEQAPLTLAQQAAGLPHGEPLFNTSFNHRHQPLAAPAGLGRPVSRWERTHYPIAVAIDDLGDGFEIGAQCAAGIAPEALAAQLQQALQGLADALLDAPDTPALAIEVLPPAQRHQQLVDWNASAHDAFDARPVHRLVEAQAAATPEATAAVFGDQSLSYA
ncbi:AMP-binding protein, partial [Hydrogenophaga sp. T2]|uniref:AMP-binding protein n=1 Tax=Hydrogenophaga sp. T2 TaxID=3132823 RepID=UPI003CEBC790